MSRVPSALTASMPDVWQGRRLQRGMPVLATGHPGLDGLLPAGGWPLGAVTELLTETPGAGELSLVLPALAEATSKSQWVILVNPPWVPYPPAMRGHGIALEQVLVVRARNAQECLWACEQALRGVRGGIVMAWPENPKFSHLRRLQLAASAGRKLAFLFRSTAAASEATPAALRLRVQADAGGTHVTILKCRGRRPDTSLLIRRSTDLPGVTALPVTAPAMPATVTPLSTAEAPGVDVHHVH